MLCELAVTVASLGSAVRNTPYQFNSITKHGKIYMQCFFGLQLHAGIGFSETHKISKDVALSSFLK
jgi:hypothetical protein